MVTHRAGMPPSCKGKICTVVELSWHLPGANGIEGRGPPLIGAIQGTIVIDQYDFEKAQLNDGSLNLVRSWFDRIQVRLRIKNQHKRTQNFTAVCYSCIS